MQGLCLQGPRHYASIEIVSEFLFFIYHNITINTSDINIEKFLMSDNDSLEIVDNAKYFGLLS